MTCPKIKNFSVKNFQMANEFQEGVVFLRVQRSYAGSLRCWGMLLSIVLEYLKNILTIVRPSFFELYKSFVKLITEVLFLRYNHSRYFFFFYKCLLALCLWGISTVKLHEHVSLSVKQYCSSHPQLNFFFFAHSCWHKKKIVKMAPITNITYTIKST